MPARSAAPADLEALLALRMALFDETGEALPPAEREAVLQANAAFFGQPPGDCRSWVVEEGGEIVAAGTLALFVRPPYPGNLAGREAYLLNMYTRPAHRGRGHARAVLRAALDHARASRVGKVWLHATATGRPLYEAHGFVPAGSYLELTLPAD